MTNRRSSVPKRPTPWYKCRKGLSRSTFTRASCIYAPSETRAIVAYRPARRQARREEFRQRALVGQRVRNDRYRRRQTNRAIRTVQCDSDASPSTSQDRSFMKDELQRLLRRAGCALTFFVGVRVQRCRELGSLFGALLWSAIPLIKRAAVALDKRALKTGMHIADVVISGQNIKAAEDVMRGLFSSGVRPHKRITRWVMKRRVSAAKRRTGQTDDVFDDGFRAKTILRGGPEGTGSLQRALDSDHHRRRKMGGTPTAGLPLFGWSHRIPAFFIYYLRP